jgi:RNA polymerase sigma factor (sigma-70 family)
VTTRLTLDEEAALALRVRQGDLIARNQLVTANLGLAKSIARSIRCPEHGRGCDDLEQLAFVALCRAANHYDPAKCPGVRFASYAWAVILNSCRHGCQPRASSVHTEALGVDVQAPAAPAVDLDETPGQLLERTPGLAGMILRARYPQDGTAPKTLREIAEEMGITRQRVHQLEREAIGALRRTLGRQWHPRAYRESA